MADDMVSEDHTLYLFRIYEYYRRDQRDGGFCGSQSGENDHIRHGAGGGRHPVRRVRNCDRQCRCDEKRGGDLRTVGDCGHLDITFLADRCAVSAFEGDRSAVRCLRSEAVLGADREFFIRYGAAACYDGDGLFFDFDQYGVLYERGELMDFLREYLLSLTASALFCAVVVGFVGEKGSLGKIVKLIAGIFMMLTIASPFARLDISGWTDYFDGLTAQTGAAVARGENFAKESLEEIIKEKTQTYILDKAKAYGAHITAEVTVDGSDLPVPCGVRIRGSISPYGRKQMEAYIRDELGIELEAQQWIPQ